MSHSTLNEGHLVVKLSRYFRLPGHNPMKLHTVLLGAFLLACVIASRFQAPLKSAPPLKSAHGMIVSQGTTNEFHILVDRPEKVSVITEADVLAAFPTLANYFKQTFNGKPAVCCGRPIMWQTITYFARIVLWAEKRPGFVWKVEDDVDIFVNGSSILGDYIRNQTKDADFIGVPFSKNCKSPWKRARSTPEFLAIANVPHTCFSDAIQGYSPRMIKAMRAALEANIITFGEEWVHVVAVNANLTVRKIDPCQHGVLSGVRSKPSEDRLFSLNLGRRVCSHGRDRA